MRRFPAILPLLFALPVVLNGCDFAEANDPAPVSFREGRVDGVSLGMTEADLPDWISTDCYQFVLVGGNEDVVYYRCEEDEYNGINVGVWRAAGSKDYLVRSIWIYTPDEPRGTLYEIRSEENLHIGSTLAAVYRRLGEPECTRTINGEVMGSVHRFASRS